MSTLRLVPPAGQGTDPPAAPRKKKRHKIPPITLEEAGRLRSAVRNLYVQFGSSWGCLAAVLDVSGAGLQDIARGRNRGSAAVALRVARVSGVSVEALLSGLADAGKCSTCGQKMPSLARSAGGAS
jgi:hypothetical protein